MDILARIANEKVGHENLLLLDGAANMAGQPPLALSLSHRHDLTILRNSHLLAECRDVRVCVAYVLQLLLVLPTAHEITRGRLVTLDILVSHADSSPIPDPASAFAATKADGGVSRTTRLRHGSFFHHRSLSLRHQLASEEAVV